MEILKYVLSTDGIQLDILKIYRKIKAIAVSSKYVVSIIGRMVVIFLKNAWKSHVLNIRIRNSE